MKSVKVPLCKTKSYKSSFFPHDIFLQNCNVVKDKQTLYSFKCHLIKRDKPGKIFYYGDQNLSILHSRIRMSCSPLNFHLCLIMHFIPSPKCDCGADVESPRHCLQCPLYTGFRNNMVFKINGV